MLSNTNRNVCGGFIMSVEPEFILFAAAVVLTIIVAVGAFFGLRHILREERQNPPGDGA
jgi:uncharacterized phage infection (PIP) family protein YhgE